jgi:hypothetical protein
MQRMEVGSTFYEDRDGDGYGNSDESTRACERPEGFVENRDDCDDSAETVSPEAVEVCNAVDDNCDGRTDEGVGTILYPDEDNDGFGVRESGVMACWDLSGYTNSPGDCDDSNPDVNPDAEEVCDDADNDCDGEIDEHATDGFIEFWPDLDGDGHGAGEPWSGCSVPDGFASSNDDCDDLDPARFPSNPEVCNEIDDDCDGVADEGVTLLVFADADGDGFGDADDEGTRVCSVESGWSSTNDDCDDMQPTVYPGADELCDGLDNDCNAVADDDPIDGSTYYLDLDLDGYGDSASSLTRCEAPIGYIAASGDCDDSRFEVNPSATESCTTSFDDNCDGSTNARDAEGCTVYYTDDDGDGYGIDDGARCYCEPTEDWSGFWGGDCNDEDATINPEAEEVCDGVDQNCNGSIDEGALIAFYADLDADGFGTGAPTFACAASGDLVDSDTDCDDGDPEIYPGSTEYCDGIDNDCDGVTDDEAVDGSTYYADFDDDGFGDPAEPTISCGAPPGYVASYTDCGPDSAAVYPGAIEVCDGLDNDCDGSVDEDTLDTPTWYRDADGDGFGTGADAVEACTAPFGYVADDTDCNDDNSSINPLGIETCETDEDDDCDGSTNDRNAASCEYFYADRDGDGYGDDDDYRCHCRPRSVWTEPWGEDCDDDDPSINPEGVETCDGNDEDCDGTVDEDASWDCPSACEQYTWNTHSYWFCETWRNWYEAKSFCEDRNYDLVTVNNSDEQYWLIGAIRSWWEISNQAYWIGLNDTADETCDTWPADASDWRSGWTWSSGEAYTYQAWSNRYGYFGQPDNSGDEDCVEMNLWNWQPWNADWNDSRCWNDKYFICEASP